MDGDSGHIAAGTVVDVDPGKRVTFTWGWEGDGDPPPGASTVTVTLTPVDGGTEVRLVHDGLTDEHAARHAEGWNHFLDRLVAAGQRGDAGPDEWATAPDPLNELSSAEATLAVLKHVLRGINASDLSKQTRCTEYDVSQRADHLMTAITRIGATAGAQMPPRDQDAPLETQVADAAQAALEAWRRRGLEGYGRARVDSDTRGVRSRRPVHRILSPRLGFRNGRRSSCWCLRAVSDYVQGWPARSSPRRYVVAEGLRIRSRPRPTPASSVGSSLIPAVTRSLPKHPPIKKGSS